MELLTKPDIVKYVSTRMGDSPAFRELRALYPDTVNKLETQIISKAEGVFLWVVLVTEKIISTARGNNDLHEIWNIFNTLPPGLEQLYESMLKRLNPAQKEVASKMYQLLFRWKDTFIERFGMLEFWAAINCHDPTQVQPFPAASNAPNILLALERRLAGITGGVLQVLHAPEEDKTTSETTIEFLHRTVYDWLTSIKTSIIEQGHHGYDPALVLTSVLASRWNAPSTVFCPVGETKLKSVFEAARLCNDSRESRAKLLIIIEQFKLSGWYSFGLNETSQVVKQDLMSLSDSAARSCLAARHLCPPYLRAKLENGSGETGLELPQHLRFMPTALWDKTSRGMLFIMQEMLSSVWHKYRSNLGELHLLNLRLKTIELLMKAKVVPHRVLRSRVNRASVFQRGVLLSAVLDGLEGKGWNEITEIHKLPALST